MYVCNCHTPLQTGLKITNRQHTRHSLFFNYQSPCVYTYLLFLTYHLPLQQEIWLAVHSRSNLIGVTYIHLSLTHSLTHIWPVHNIPDVPTTRNFFYKKITQKNNSKTFLCWPKRSPSLWNATFTDTLATLLPLTRHLKFVTFGVWSFRCLYGNIYV